MLLGLVQYCTGYSRLGSADFAAYEQGGHMAWPARRGSLEDGGLGTAAMAVCTRRGRHSLSQDVRRQQSFYE